MLKDILRNTYKQVKKSSIPPTLKNKFIYPNKEKLEVIESSIKKNYHKGWRSEKKYNAEAYRNDLKLHLNGRLEADRLNYIPLFHKSLSLENANILEIGCGTGSSTVALAEQGANVIGIDIDKGAIQVAKDRCKAYGLKANFIHGNAIDIYDTIKNEKFDLIIFFACIEHMVYDERIKCLATYYDLLPKGKYLSIIETPNRLWYFDDHTAILPFYHWLPDKLAFDYAKFSKRNNFKELYLDYSDEKYLHFLRRGRGFSFHELESALNIPISELSIDCFLKKNFIPFSLDSKFHQVLRKIYPSLHKGFCYPYIDITIKKK